MLNRAYCLHMTHFCRCCCFNAEWITFFLRYGFKEKQLREEFGARIKRMKVLNGRAQQVLIAAEHLTG